ncbi:protein of unknown function [Bradyrhizobium vignae]|uniref:Uncharacterized protein n=1 Tax=Bradyrhizobium vignae TaxID=1549949 RepID=A0A2U3Q841_9BRAD|nr:protein of unknown function [Bradyrhizobium vignae]
MGILVRAVTCRSDGLTATQTPSTINRRAEQTVAAVFIWAAEKIAKASAATRACVASLSSLT